MQRLEGTYVLFNDDEPAARAHVQRFAQEAAGDVGRFQELFRERFNYAAILLQGDHPAMQNQRPGTMIKIA